MCRTFHDTVRGSRSCPRRLVLALLALVGAGCADAPSTTTQDQDGVSMEIAKGSFHVSMDPQSSDAGEGSTLQAMKLTKEFEGDLTGSSSGHILLVSTEVEGSAGYVAVERFTGMLGERTGSFVMQHYGILAADGQGQEHLVTIVPDTGTGELTGIRGTMTIEVQDGHTYELKHVLDGGRSPG